MECHVKDCPRHLMATNACELGRLDELEVMMKSEAGVAKDYIPCYHRKFKLRDLDKK